MSKLFLVSQRTRFRVRLICLLAILAVISSSFRAVAADSYRTFAAIPFGATIAHTRELMASKGYKFVKSDNDSDTFLGQISDTKTDILVYYDDTHTAAKFIVNMETPDEEARRMYTQMHDQMIQKYGPPKSDFHFFSSPYESGDGYEATAFKVGKAHFAAYWPQPDGDNMMAIEITKSLTVKIGYEGPTWGAYLDRHRANTSKDI